MTAETGCPTLILSYVRNGEIVNGLSKRLAGSGSDTRNEFPQACIDAPGVDRGKIHALIGDAALKFYDASLNVPRSK